MTERSEETTNVVPLFRGTKDGTGDAACAAVERYWTQLSDGRLMPWRSEIDPRGIGSALDRTFLLERVAPGVARFRVAGTHLTDLLGMDVRGMPLTIFAGPAARDVFAEAVETVCEEPARVELGLRSPVGFRRNSVGARLLLLPLRDDDGQSNRILGCLSATAIPRRVPVRFDVTSDTRQTLIGYADHPDRDSGAARPSLRVITPD
ncbi:PAS domain-containing protein [Tranquillimonas rosea]|uniref:PAS domain-containing protein n=1 Tax=Tranquillimonas rosea TaxID=641238 RepID=A0A1H9P4Z7_9RHOB|nr:PAS domain-containing protein [Tranquillimonas rosea]SER43374.1 PAS domain-containing protein [Tranquillimonas rosea]